MTYTFSGSNAQFAAASVLDSSSCVFFCKCHCSFSLFFFQECCLCNLRGGALKTTTDNRSVELFFNSDLLSHDVLSHLFWTLMSAVVLSHRNQLGPRHLCHRGGRGSLRQRHRQGAGGRQRRSRVAQESGETPRPQPVSATRPLDCLSSSRHQQT